MTPRPPLIPLLLLGLAFASPAAPHMQCAPVVAGAWVRMMPMMPMGAGYFSMRNTCRETVVLTGVASRHFGEASMHETRVEAGMSRMRALERVVVAPGTTVNFQPGGRHLMLMGPDAGVAPGRRVRVELKLADGRRLPVDFDVRSAAP